MAAGNIKAEMIPTMATANKTSVKVYPLFAQLNFLKKFNIKYPIYYCKLLTNFICKQINKLLKFSKNLSIIIL